MNPNSKRGRPANITQDQVMQAFLAIQKEKEAVAEQGEEITVTASEVHKRLGTTASQTTVAKYLSRGLKTVASKDESDLDVGEQVRQVFVQAGMQAVEILQAQYQKFQVEMHKQCLEKIAEAQRSEEAAWSRAEELEQILVKRDQELDTAINQVKRSKEKDSEAALKIESLETLLDSALQEKETWIAEMKQALLETNN